MATREALAAVWRGLRLTLLPKATVAVIDKLADIVAAAQADDDSPEVPILVEHKLLGLLPLDADDEGLDPVDVGITLASIHAYFEALVQAREIALARELIERRGKTQGEHSR
ncbi:MAG: hypothetical protein C1943_07795 [Halochromatium sp.]|nr:hypothetical protein [Halochromatium sp.]